VPKLPHLLASAPADRVASALAASRTRWLLLIGSVIAVLVLALLTYHLRAQWGNWGGNIL